jgi:hypothetical protein
MSARMLRRAWLALLAGAALTAPAAADPIPNKSGPIGTFTLVSTLVDGAPHATITFGSTTSAAPPA